MNTRRLALHDVGHQAEGDAFSEESHFRGAVVDGTVQAVMLHGVLYPQVHVNGFKKKKKGGWMWRKSSVSGFGRQRGADVASSSSFADWLTESFVNCRTRRQQFAHR